MIRSFSCFCPFSESQRDPKVSSSGKMILRNRPYSEQRHARYESEAVRDRLTVFPMASAVKS